MARSRHAITCSSEVGEKSGCALGAGDLTGSPCGRPGRNPVVDDDDDAILHALTRTFTAISVSPSLEFDALPRLDRPHLRGRESGPTDDVVVDHTHPRLTDGPHREFGLERYPELADQDDVERSVEGAGHLGGDRHAPARQPQDDG